MKYNIPSRIMINGRACVGKDLLADYLIKNHGFTRVAFSEGLYDIAYRYHNMTTKDRKLLQLIGQKHREIDPDVWVKYTYKKALELDRVVISDVRQANEYLFGVKNGFIPIRITADFNKRVERCRLRDGIEPDTSLWETEGETGADNFEYIELVNNGTPEELYSAFLNAVQGGQQNVTARI